MLVKQVLFILVLISVKSFSQNYDSIHFENILKTTPAKDLFLKKIIVKDKIIYNDQNDQNIKYNATEALAKYKSTRYASQIDLKIKKNGKLKEIGKGFGIDLYTESEKVFTHGILNFNQFILFSNNKDQIIAYKLFNNNEKENNIKKFIEQYSKLYKNDVVSNDREEQYYFYMNDRTVKLVVNKNRVVTSMSVSLSSEEKFVEKEINIEVLVIYNNFTNDEQIFFKERLDK